MTNTLEKPKPPALPALNEDQMELLTLFEAIKEAHEIGQDPPQVTLETLADYLQTALDKRDRIAEFILHTEETEQAIEAEIARLRSRKERISAARERMQEYVLEVMEVMDMKSLQGELYTLTAAKNPSSVEIVDDLLIPPEFLLQPQPSPPRPDKSAIKKALKIGKEVPGARLVEAKTRLEIR
jgi:Siphovirus Gp157